MLTRNLEFGGIQENIDNGALYAVSITARIFLRAEPFPSIRRTRHDASWERTQPRGPRRCQSASSTLHGLSGAAFIFPAVKITANTSGDGSMRQIRAHQSGRCTWAPTGCWW